MSVQSMLALSLLLLVAALAPATAAGEPFPFIIPWEGEAKSIVDVSDLNPAPLDESRRVVIRDGHFYDQTGRRVRFVGMNLAGPACFPSKEDAARVAARFHRYGVNAVRFADIEAIRRGADRTAQEPPADRLDPESLDRFDYLMYQFKLHGIYVDIGLRPGQVTNWFDPESIARQKLFLEQLLTHYNPYTKTRYLDEPTVAYIELTNEDSVIGLLEYRSPLPPQSRDVLTAGWNRFLRDKYHSTDALRKAWNVVATPLGANLLRNPQFAEETSGWTLEQDESAQGTLKTEGISIEGGAPPGRALRVTVLPSESQGQGRGRGRRVQVQQVGLDLTVGQRYTLSFAARAEGSRSLRVGAGLDQEPWTNVGLERRVGLTPQWQRVRFSFMASDTVTNHARLTFALGRGQGDVLLADVALQPGGGDVELAAGESLEAGTIPLVSISESPQGRDFAVYLLRVERDYSQGMKDYITNTLKAKAPVTCSQPNFSGLAGAWREANMDWVDTHAYHQHPQFPGNDWDANNFRIGNTPLVQDGGESALSWIEAYRVAGKPFTVGEYDHPFPNEYAAEMIPVAFSFAAWQDWDGIFFWLYHAQATDWEVADIPDYFDQNGHVGKFGFLPAAAELFLRGEVSPAPATATLLIPKGRVPELVANGSEPTGLWLTTADGQGPLTRPEMLTRRLGIRFVEGSGDVKLVRDSGAAGDTQLDWPATDPAQARLTVRAPNARVAAGRLGGRSVELGGLSIAVAPSTRNFASLVLTSRDGRPIESARALLLTAVDKVENTGTQWNAERTFTPVWGTAPALTEAVAATVTLETKARKATVYALSGAGSRGAEVPSTLKDGRLTFSIGPEYRTIWYEIATQ